MKLAVYVSGAGSLLKKLIDSGKHEIIHVIGDRVCPALTIAVNAGIPIYSHTLIATLPKPDLSILAGFKSLAPTGFEPNKFINIHPALLPAFGGKGMYGHKVFSKIRQSQVNFTGCTVHFCNERYDDGAIILQKCVKVDPDWSCDDIAEATHELELSTLLAAIEGIEYVAKYRKDHATHLDYIREVHKAATEVIQDDEDQVAWARVGRRSLLSMMREDTVIDDETKRCAAIAEEMERYDIAAVIRGEMEIGDDLINEQGDC